MFRKFIYRTNNLIKYLNWWKDCLTMERSRNSYPVLNLKNFVLQNLNYWKRIWNDKISNKFKLSSVHSVRFDFSKYWEYSKLCRILYPVHDTDKKQSCLNFNLEYLSILPFWLRDPLKSRLHVIVVYQHKDNTN